MSLKKITQTFKQNLLKHTNLLSPSFLGSFKTITHIKKSSSVEIAVIGRSNVGKSSFLNSWLKRKKLAKTSSKPGRTRAINLYSLAEDSVLISDLPGYGFARVSKKEQSTWQEMMTNYLKNRDNIRIIVFLIDIRRQVNDEDKELIFWLKSLGFDILYLFTKIDKIKKSQVHANLCKNLETLEESKENSVLISNTKKLGFSDFSKKLLKRLEEAYEKS